MRLTPRQLQTTAPHPLVTLDGCIRLQVEGALSGGRLMIFRELILGLLDLYFHHRFCSTNSTSAAAAAFTALRKKNLKRPLCKKAETENLEAARKI